MCRARWAEGNAMFTIVESSTTISCAMAMTSNASQRRGSGAMDESFSASCVLVNDISRCVGGCSRAGSMHYPADNLADAETYSGLYPRRMPTPLETDGSLAQAPPLPAE